MPHYTPLRYPGGKGKLANYIKVLLRQNNLIGGHYVEPYAGGAGVALALLFEEYASRIYINDINRSIYAFWHSVLNDTVALCDLIKNTPVTIEERNQQKAVQTQKNIASLLELGFSTFFLNRTNHSGVLEGGVIGGKNQAGKWLIDARYNKEDLIGRIKKIARYRNRIRLYNQDAVELLQEVTPNLPTKTLIYLDPPYYVKGPKLYQNSYDHAAHVEVARMIAALHHNWVVSYDNVDTIAMLYEPFEQITYDLNCSVSTPQRGSEIMFFRGGLNIPNINNPVNLDFAVVHGTQQQLPI